MNEHDVVDARLEEAWADGCDCDPAVYVNHGGGLFLRVRLVHDVDCPLGPGPAT